MKRQADPVKARTRVMHSTLKRRGGTMTLEEFRALYFRRMSRRPLCTYCNAALHTGNVSVDHLTPVDRGGSHAEGNLTFVCRPCNRAKGSLTYAEFMSLLKHLREWERENRNLKLASGVLTAMRVGNSFRIGAQRRAKQ